MVSAFNIKGRCADIGITLTDLYHAAKEEGEKQFPGKFSGVTYYMFSDMHRGRYQGPLGNDFLRVANDVLTEAEKHRKSGGKKI